MTKINLGLFGLLIIILMILFLFNDQKTQMQEIKEELESIKFFLEDIDHDLHETFEKK
tara:strand:+ start:182 stop:355 length:174 start_codon:yes stop_codon:yes gene_type:complete